MYVPHVPVGCLRRSEEGIRSPELELWVVVAALCVTAKLPLQLRALICNQVSASCFASHGLDCWHPT